ncbi:NADH-quinone oxidoreductase subunit C [uncultured Faecalicoccus sp.]|uniref:NADH-quinone oxidoreductase subunit C n=1 Tax=uncultured Faecalicoccus sp. TaxID=1971760 RepID=UPI0026301D53|nr:NADH-quinone oxidoreductase subunit C [uncultured Faecalicoccus sp.]
MSDRIITLGKAELYAAAVQKKMNGWRLAQICAVTTEDGYEMSYTFVKDKNMDTLRVHLDHHESISSITQIFPCAFLQENEAAELFGVLINNITMDYKHKLYRIDVEAPFGPDKEEA